LKLGSNWILERFDKFGAFVDRLRWKRCSTVVVGVTADVSRFVLTIDSVLAVRVVERATAVGTAVGRGVWRRVDDDSGLAVGRGSLDDAGIW
jgi:hypothetical protein